MAPLLPPLLIMTGPRGPEQREERLRGQRAGKEGRKEEGEEREAAATDILFWGETSPWPDTRSGRLAFPAPPANRHQGEEPTAIPRLCSLQDPCKGEGEDPLGVSSNSRLIRLGNAIRCQVIYFTGPSAKLGDVEGLCHHLSEGSLGFS